MRTPASGIFALPDTVALTLLHATHAPRPRQQGGLVLRDVGATPEHGRDTQPHCQPRARVLGNIARIMNPVKSNISPSGLSWVCRSLGVGVDGI